MRYCSSATTYKMPATFNRGNFLKENEPKDKPNKSEKRFLKNQEVTLEAIKKGFASMNAGITHLILQSKKSNNDTTVNTVKVLEIKTTNERIDSQEEQIKVLMDKVEEQSNRIIKLKETHLKCTAELNKKHF